MNEKGVNDNTVNDNAVNDNAVNVRRQIYMIFLRLRGDLRGPPLPVFLKDVPKHVRHLHVVFGRSIQSSFRQERGVGVAKWSKFFRFSHDRSHDRDLHDR